jgi:hypothetical protein
VVVPELVELEFVWLVDVNTETDTVVFSEAFVPELVELVRESELLFVVELEVPEEVELEVVVFSDVFVPVELAVEVDSFVPDDVPDDVV